MKISEAMQIRHSRRSYLKTPLREEDIERLKKAIQRCNAMSGLNIQLICDNSSIFSGILKNYGMFKNVNNYIALVGSDDDLTREKIGYYGEKLVLMSTAMGLGTCWVGGTFNKKDCYYEAEKDEILHLIITLGNAGRRLTSHERLITSIARKGGKDKGKISEILGGDPPDWYWSGIDAVLKTPAPFNRRSIKIRYDDTVVSAGLTAKNHVDYIYLGIAKLHFEIGSFGGEWEWGDSATFHHE